MGCGWSRLGNIAPDPCLLKAGAPSVERTARLSFFLFEMARQFRIALIDPLGRERRSAETKRRAIKLRPGARASRLVATGCSAAPASALSRHRRWGDWCLPQYRDRPAPIRAAR